MKAFAQRLGETLRDRLWLVLLSIVAGVALILAGIHTLAVGLLWLVLMIALLNPRGEKAAPPHQPASTSAVAPPSALGILVAAFNALDMPILVISGDESVRVHDRAAEDGWGAGRASTVL